jgi:hypothetical protein
VAIDYGPDPNEFAKRFRVTTLSYNYRLEHPGGGDRWRMHWHPEGISDVRKPHLHIPPDLKVHRPCDRMTFENAIRWCIEDGAPLACTLQKAENELVRLGELTVLELKIPDQRGSPEKNLGD